MKQLSIIGAGSWGTALSIVLAPRFPRVRLWAFEEGLAGSIGSERENKVFLPGYRVPGNVEATDRLSEAVKGSECILLVVPSKFLRGTLRALMPHVSDSQVFVSATKGIETGSLLRMSEVLRQECPFPPRCATLSGPTFAREVAGGEPAAVVISSPDHELAVAVQGAFSGPTFRLYTNPDQVGVEIGGSLKNVIAIAAGVVQGLGLGNNTLAALVTRGLAEITRLAIACGGQQATLAGLAGLGDLMLTCTGELSRNRGVGVELARGRKLDEILAATKMVAEGVDTTFAAVDLAGRLRIEMPIAEQMHAVLRDGKCPRSAIRDLMDRALRSE